MQNYKILGKSKKIYTTLLTFNTQHQKPIHKRKIINFLVFIELNFLL